MILKNIFHVIVFPGFLFTAVAGLLASFIDRKVSARVQWRVGPPWYQPFADFVKLLGKEIIVPKGVSRYTFLAAPVIGLFSATIVSVIIWMAIISPETSFLGDIIVVIYFLAMVPIAVILGGAVSRNPLASLGASREMKLVLSYELPFILAIFSAVTQSNGHLKLGELITAQAQNGLAIGSFGGALAFIVAIMCMQAKLTYPPFDIPEAETEIVAGPLMEYSGAALAMFKLTKAMMLFTLPMFLVVIFMGGIKFSSWSILWGILKYVLLLVIIVLIKNTNPRVRIDQAMRFFWGPMLVISVLAIVLSIWGI